MLKRIDPADAVLGIYIHRLEGNWFSHPFWRARFRLTDAAMLDRLRHSRVAGVIIDTTRGVDPDAVSAPAVPAQVRVATRAVREAQAAPAPAAPRAQAPRVLGAVPAEVQRGFGRARTVADRGLKVVSHVFLEMRLGKAVPPGKITPVIDAIIASMQSNPFAFNGLMQFRREHEHVYRHALATAALMIALGRSLRLSTLDLHTAGLAGLLLDAGVVDLPLDTVGGDPRRLPEVEWRSHVALGQTFIERSRLSPEIARAALEHHERIDGTGWPNRTGGASLSQLGRMAAICDTYDLLAAGDNALDPVAALAAMKRDTGAFDPELLALFETTIGVWPTGALVAMRSGRLAVVIGQNRYAPDKPLVALFYDPASDMRINDVWIDLATCYGADAIAGPAAIGALPPHVRSKADAALVAAIDHVARPDRAANAHAA